MSFLVLVVCLLVPSYSRPIDLSVEPEEFLKISCVERPFFATLSMACQEYFNQTSLPPILAVTSSSPPIAVIPPVPSILTQTASLAAWGKALLAIFSFFFTFYTSFVSYLKFIKKLDLRQALTLDLCGVRSSSNLDAASLPVTQEIEMDNLPSSTL